MHIASAHMLSIASMQRIVKEGSLPFHFDKSRNSRFGLMPRHATSEDAIKWCGFMLAAA
jgi:hypothetical protein